MAKINTSGEPPQEYEKPLIDEDAYVGVIDVDPEIRLVGNERFGKKNKILMKIILDQTDTPVELPLFLNPNVIKGTPGTKYSDSKLYTILEKAKLLEEFKNKYKDGEIQDEEVLDYVTAKLKGRRAKVMVKNVKGADGMNYSTIKDIIKFVDIPENIQVNFGGQEDVKQ